MDSQSLNNFFKLIFVSGWQAAIFWNAVVSLVAIIFTVVFIDQSAKKRETKRWLPAKNNVYSKLLGSLITIVSYLGMSHKWIEDRLYIYYFGVYFIGVHYDLKKLKYKEVEDFSGNSLMGLDEYTVEQLENALKNINSLLDDFLQLFEPDLVDKVFRVRERIPPVIAKLNHYLNIDNDDREGSISLVLLAEEIFPLLVWLSKRTSKIIKKSVIEQ